MNPTTDINTVIYTALFVDDPKKLLEMFPAKHPVIYAHHSTNKFRPKDIQDLEVGKKSMLKIFGRVTDEKGDCVLVENPKSEKVRAHITISCAEGVKPDYSNEVIENAYTNNTVEIFNEPLYIEVTEGYYDRNGAVNI